MRRSPSVAAFSLTTTTRGTPRRSRPCRAAGEEAGLKPKLLFQPLRVAVCGNMVSPPLFEAMMLMDPADIVARIDGVTETVFSERAN